MKKTKRWIAAVLIVSMLSGQTVYAQTMELAETSETAATSEISQSWMENPAGAGETDILAVMTESESAGIETEQIISESKLETGNVLETEISNVAETKSEADAKSEIETNTGTEIKDETESETETAESSDWQDDEVALIQNGDFFNQHLGGTTSQKARGIFRWQSTLKSRLENAFSSYETQIYVGDLNISKETDYTDMRNTYQATITGNYFYISGAYSYNYTISDNIIQYIRIYYNSDYTDDNGNPDAARIQKAVNAFDARTEAALNSLEQAYTSLQKVLLLHDFLIRECDYDYANYLNDSIPMDSYSAYGALVEGKAVCNGYALAYGWLLQKSGIESYVVSSDSMNHAWNLVNVDGTWYHVDVTWDDPVFRNQTYRGLYNDDYADEGFVTHQYFLYSDSEFQNLNHYGWKIQTGGDTVPSANKSGQFSNYLFRTNPVSSFTMMDSDWFMVDINRQSLWRSPTLTTANSMELKEGQVQYGFGYDGILYYSSGNAVYKWNSSEGDMGAAWQPEGQDETLSEMSIKNDKLICVTVDSDNHSKHYETAISELVGFTEPEQPILGKAENDAQGDIKISWETAEHAEGYRIYRKESGKGWKGLANVSADETTYTDVSGAIGTKYTYTVRAYAMNGDEMVLSVFDSNGISAQKLPAKVTLVSAKDSGESSIIFQWQKVNGADGYRVFRKESGKSWTGLKNVTTGSYTDDDVKPGVQYTYTVRAYKTVSGKMIYGDYDKIGKSAYCLPETVVLTSAKDNENGAINIQWHQVKSSDGYRIYRKTASEGWKALDNVSAGTTVYTDQTGAIGTTYTYTVRAFKKNGQTTTYGDFDHKGVSTRQLPATVKLNSASYDSSKGVSVSWGKVSKSTGYVLYRKTSTTSWIRVAKITSNSQCSYVDTSAKQGTTYQYTVRAYGEVNGKEVLGGFDKNGVSVSCK